MSNAGIGRASVLLASGTLFSRLLGFASAIVLTHTIAQRSVGSNAFALANQLPNNLYAIIAGGLLSSVFVPAIVRAGLHDDGGQRFVNRLVTLGILVFAGAGVIATVAAPVLIRIYAQTGSTSTADDFIALATAFAFWCLPQVLFYALYSLFGEVLNARGIFGPFTWAPAINNVIVIAGLVLFTVLFGTDIGATSTPASAWTPGMVALLGGTASLGVAAQAFLLCFFWRRAGLRYRPDFHFRGAGLGAAGRAALWTLGMILVTQLAGVVQSRVTSLAATTEDAAYQSLKNTWLIFMLPHSIAAVSIATAYFTRMSTHHRDGRDRELVADLAASLRSIGLIIVFASVGLIVLAYPFSALFAKDGNFTDVATMAPVLIAFLVGLVPFSVLYVLRRTFYAVNDTRTPFFITVFQAALFCLLIIPVASLPESQIAVGIATVTTIAGIAQTTLAIVLIRRKLGLLHGRAILRRHVQFLLAAVPAALLGLAIVALLGAFRAGGFGSSSFVGAAVTMVIAGGVMAIVYAGALRLMHNPELADFLGPVIRRLRPRR